MYRISILLLLGLALAGCGARPGGPRARAGTPTATSDGTAAPRPTARRSVDNVVTADGQLVLPLPPQALSFPAGGLLTKLNVAEGQSVAAGTVLATLDVLSADLGVAQAETSLAQARAALAKLERGDPAVSGRLEVEQAKNQLWGQQAQRDSTCGAAENKMATQASCDQAQAAVQSAEQAVQLAQKRLEATLANQAGDLASARAQVEQARLALAQAQRDRERTELVAPFDGTVTQVAVAEGIRVGPGSPVVTLAQTTPLRFATTNLGERNVGDIHEGAAATVTLNSFPDQPLKATVQRVAPQATTAEGGLTVFSVYLDVEPEDLALRAGMTGRAEIRIGGGE
jgi:multidrug resistance efflux pump